MPLYYIILYTYPCLTGIGIYIQTPIQCHVHCSTYTLFPIFTCGTCLSPRPLPRTRAIPCPPPRVCALALTHAHAPARPHAHARTHLPACGITRAISRAVSRTRERRHPYQPINHATDMTDYKPNPTNANKARREALTVTAATRAEITELAKSGASTEEISMLLTLSPSQVDRALRRTRTDERSDAVAQSVQIRRNGGGAVMQEQARVANQAALKAIKRINDIIPEETDLSKLSTALKVLTGIVQSAEVKTEITETISRLRGR